MIGSTSRSRRAAIVARPDRTAAEHDGGLAGADRGTVGGVESDCHRLGQRGQGRRQAVRHLESDHVRQHHLFAVAAGIEVGVADRVQPRHVERHRNRHDDVTDLAVADVVSELDDLAAELVAHDDVSSEIHDLHGWEFVTGEAAGLVRHLDHLLAVLQRVEVGPADATCERFDQHLARRGAGSATSSTTS